MAVLVLVALFFGGKAMAQTTFTGSRGFAPTFKTSSDSPAPKSDLSIQLPGGVELNGCAVFVYTGIAGDVCLCADESTDQIYFDKDCDATYEPSAGEFYLGAGGGGGATTFDYFGATTESTAAKFGNSNVWWQLFCDVSDACTIKTSTASPTEIGIFTNQTFRLYDEEGDAYMTDFDPDAGTRNAMWSIESGYQLIKSIEWPADAMKGDGTECDSDPTDETIGSDPARGIRCPMTSSETDGTITSLMGVTVPGDFDKTADATFYIKAYLITDSGAGTWHGQIAITCVAQGEARSYGTAAGLDLTPDAADVVDDEIHDTAAAVVDTDTTGANCDPGDTLYWQYTSCDTDATPSTGCTSSAGFENDMSIFSIRMEYYANSLSQ